MTFKCEAYCRGLCRPDIDPSRIRGIDRAITVLGYESPSQSNGDFKRFFGRSPDEEARCMKTLFSLLPPAQLEALAMKH